MEANGIRWTAMTHGIIDEAIEGQESLVKHPDGRVELLPG